MIKTKYEQEKGELLEQAKSLKKENKRILREKEDLQRMS